MAFVSKKAFTLIRRFLHLVMSSVHWGMRKSEKKMSSSGPDLVYQLDNVQGMVNVLSTVGRKRH